MGHMTEDPLADIGARYLRAVEQHRAAVKAVKRAEEKRAATIAEVENLRGPLQAAIIEAGRARRRPRDIAALTGYGSERIRQILRAAGVEPFERESAT